jgi:LPS export ABC transporter protein LptC
LTRRFGAARLGFSTLLTACAALLFFGCPGKDAAKAKSEALPSQVIEGFKLTETADGKLVYALEAETARVYDDSNRIDVVRPEVHFYNQQQELFSTLLSQTGTVNTKTSDLVARGEVRVTTRDSMFLETDSLIWHNKEQIVTTDAAVRTRSPKGDVSGVGLTSDAGLKRIEIKNQVSGTTKYEFKK